MDETNRTKATREVTHPKRRPLQATQQKELSGLIYSEADPLAAPMQGVMS